MLIKSLLSIIILGFNWASGYAIANYCINHGMPAPSYMFWQSFGPFCVIGITLLVNRSYSHSKQQFFTVKNILYCILFACLSIIAPSYISYFSLNFIDMGIIVLFANCTPFIIYLCAVLLKLEKFNLYKMLIILIATIAILLILANSNTANIWLNIKYISYPMLTLLFLIPLSYSLSAILIGKYKIQLNYICRAFAMLFFSSLAFLPIALSHGKIYIPRFNSLIFYLLGIEILLSSLDLLLVFFIINNSSPVYYSLVGGVTTICSLFYNHFLFDRHYTLSVFIAIICVLLSIILISIISNKK